MGFLIQIEIAGQKTACFQTDNKNRQPNRLQLSKATVRDMTAEFSVPLASV
jgi:hypothetical protein